MELQPDSTADCGDWPAAMNKPETNWARHRPGARTTWTIWPGAWVDNNPVIKGILMEFEGMDGSWEWVLPGLSKLFTTFEEVIPLSLPYLLELPSLELSVFPLVPPSLEFFHFPTGPTQPRVFCFHKSFMMYKTFYYRYFAAISQKVVILLGWKDYFIHKCFIMWHSNYVHKLNLQVWMET